VSLCTKTLTIEVFAFVRDVELILIILEVVIIIYFVMPIVKCIVWYAVSGLDHKD
jgi:hypothetical protein